MTKTVHLKVVQLLCCLLLGVFSVDSDAAQILDVINDLRNGGCESRNKLPALQDDARLQAVTKQIAAGASSKQAAQQVGFHAKELSTIHLTGYDNNNDLQRVLTKNYCPLLMNPKWRLASSDTGGNEVWIVLALPQNIPTNAAQAEQQVLNLVNQARMQSRKCGSARYGATGSLRLNAVLTKAAQLHAQDMAKHQQMQHEGSDGSTPAQRLTRQGYKWRAVGENVAAGAGGAEEVVAGWLASPGHCANIMSPLFTEMGLAFAVNDRDEYAVYWAQSFATPR